MCVNTSRDPSTTRMANNLGQAWPMDHDTKGWAGGKVSGPLAVDDRWLPIHPVRQLVGLGRRSGALAKLIEVQKTASKSPS